MGSLKEQNRADSGCGRLIASFFWIFYVRDVGVAGSNPVNRGRGTHFIPPVGGHRVRFRHMGNRKDTAI